MRVQITTLDSEIPARDQSVSQNLTKSSFHSHNLTLLGRGKCASREGRIGQQLYSPGSVWIGGPCPNVSSPGGLHGHCTGEIPRACPGRTHGYKSHIHQPVWWMAHGSGQGCGRHNQLHQVNRHAQLLGADTESHNDNREDPARGWLQAGRLLCPQVTAFSPALNLNPP